MILDIMVRLRVWTAWREQLCARGALREQHRGGKCVASPITIGRVPDLQRGSALPADAPGGSDAWPCMQSVVDPRRECSCNLLEWHVDRCVGFGPRSRHGWMEELSTGLRKRGVRAWRDMASDMDGFPLCVGVGCPYVRLPADPIQIFCITFWIDLLQELRGRFAHPVASRPLEHPVRQLCL